MKTGETLIERDFVETGWLKRAAAALEVVPAVRVMLPLVVTAVVARLVFILLAKNVGDPNSMDAQNYLRIAYHLVTGRGFVVWRQPSVFVAPLYPTVLAGLRLVLGDSVWVIKVFQAVLGGASTWLVFLLGRQIINKQVGFLAALAFALHPEMIALTAFVYTEVVFIFLLLLTLLALVKALRSDNLGYFLLAGALLGLTNLCRGTLMYFPFFLLLMLFFYRRERWWRRLLGLVILVAALAVTMLPWTIRNYRHFHAIIPVATGGGDVFWTGNYLPFDGEFRYEETRSRIQELVGEVSLIERDRILMADAKKNIKEHPVASAWLFVRKIFRFWLRVYENVPEGQVRQNNWLILGVLGFTHFTLLALALYGLWHTSFRDPAIGLLLTLLFYYTLIHAATLAVPRYRQPLIPTLCIFAAAGLLKLRDILLSRRPYHGL